jgi:ABC-type multidrug transport system ATPase subunit
VSIGEARLSSAAGQTAREDQEPQVVRRLDEKAGRLRISSVSKRWPGADAPVLDGVELNVEHACVASLVGANGAGKTTLLRIVAGLIFPDRGTVALDGLTASSNRHEFQRRIGFVPAGQTGLYARFSVRSHLEYWARVAFVPRRDRRHAVEWAMRHFSLEPLARQRPERLSMGQRQRLRLALGFLHRPSLVLLDEPHTSLDPEGLDILRDAVAQHVDSGGTALWCAPSSEEVAVETNVAFALVGGRVIKA